MEGIIHRDIKPENLVFDSNGYLRLTDFGIARIWEPENNSENSGTPGYMAPEVMFKQNHGIAVDYFAVGVIAYECTVGRRPYLGRTRKEIRDAIIEKQVSIQKKDLPNGYPKEAADFINKCLMRQPSKRLGINGSEEVKGHPWFKNFDWEALRSKEIKSTYIPDIKKENYDNNHVKREWNDTEEVNEHSTMLRRPSKKEVFNSYYFDKTKIREPTRMNTSVQESHVDGVEEYFENRDSLKAPGQGASIVEAQDDEM